MTDFTQEQESRLQTHSIASLAAINERRLELINEALEHLMNYEDRPTTFVIRDTVETLRRAQ